jgi:ribulose kinase
MLPDFHGNRSPLGDPGMRGTLVGLTLATDLSHLAILYLATIQVMQGSIKEK